MLQKPRDYDQALSYGSDLPYLPVGGYVCRILKMEERSAENGKTYIVASFDIAEGEEKGFFEKRYRAEKAAAGGRREVRWRGTYNLFPLTQDGQTNPFWKGMLTCIEKSNNCLVDWYGDYDQFKGRLVGLLFREEEFEYGTETERRVGVAVRPFAVRTVDYIRSGRFGLPMRRNLGIPLPATEACGGNAAESGFTQVEEEALPF